MADNELGVLPTDLDPEVVHNLLQMEARGEIPEGIKPHIARARAAGILPPPLLGPTHPEGFSTKPSAIPDPAKFETSGRRFGFMPTAPEAVSAAKSTASSLLDPESVGGMVGAYGGAQVGYPGLGAGVGAATGNVVKQVYSGVVNPKPGYMIDPAPVATAFATGLTGEKIAGGVNAITSRPVRTIEGTAARDFFGKSTMAQQMTDSPVLDFAANVARYGPGGKKIMTDAERKQSQIALDALQKESHNINAGRPITIDPTSGSLDLGGAGQKVQTDIANQVIAAPKQSGYDQFLRKYGSMRQMVPEMGTDAEGNTVPTGRMVPTGPTVEASHKARSEALAYGRRSNITRADQAAAMKDASRASSRLERALPDQAARDEYTNISNKYRVEINRVDNPTAEALRTGKSADVIDNILNSNLHDEADLVTKTGHTNVQLLDRIQKAATPQAWSQLQADTIHRLGERALDEDGLIDVNKMRKMLENIDEPTKRKLFSTSLSQINVTLNALEQANKYKESEAGRLFIAIRTGQAGIKLAGAAVGAVSAGAAAGAYAGGREGHPVLGGAAGAATVLISPYAFAKLLTSPVGRTLLTKAAKGGMTQTVLDQTKKGLLRFGAQNVAEDVRESTVPSKYEQPTIPEPPK